MTTRRLRNWLPDWPSHHAPREPYADPGTRCGGLVAEGCDHMRFAGFSTILPLNFERLSVGQTVL